MAPHITMLLILSRIQNIARCIEGTLCEYWYNFNKTTILLITCTSQVAEGKMFTHFTKNIMDFVRKSYRTTNLALTLRGRVTHICVDNRTIVGPDNGLSPGRRKAIIWTNAGILLIWPIRTIFSEISIESHIFSFNKMRLKMWSGNWRHLCLGLNVLTS